MMLAMSQRHLAVFPNCTESPFSTNMLTECIGVGLSSLQEVQNALEERQKKDIVCSPHSRF
jgi:hypothetical protein